MILLSTFKSWIRDYFANGSRIAYDPRDLVLVLQSSEDALVGCSWGLRFALHPCIKFYAEWASKYPCISLSFRPSLVCTSFPSPADALKAGVLKRGTSAVRPAALGPKAPVCVACAAYTASVLDNAFGRCVCVSSVLRFFLAFPHLMDFSGGFFRLFCGGGEGSACYRAVVWCICVYEVGGGFRVGRVEGSGGRECSVEEANRTGGWKGEDGRRTCPRGCWTRRRLCRCCSECR
ncbi:hypothetical protein C8R45DRAFT_1183964 [Mycena sanguinolenta]|nr:hypothetical protein C8R45DRAFT_1183964 [Mycena sanguinolenta]